MLTFHKLQESQADNARIGELLQEFKQVLLERGMADMDEYGDMLKWGLPARNGMCRNFHVYHPDYCSFDDKFWGTIHFHGGEIRGTVLLGEMEHYTYRPEPNDDGDRFYDGKSFTLHKHTSLQPAGTQYALPKMVPHWLKPTTLTLTYFEEEDTEVMGDLVNPADKVLDDHKWEQSDADALQPILLAQIDARLEQLSLPA